MTRYHTTLIILGSLLATPLQAEDIPAPITTSLLIEKSFFKEHSAPATTMSLNESHISAETQGRVKAITVRVGDKVAQDDPLAMLDCRDNQLRLRRVKAALIAIDARTTLAKQQIKRTQSLRKQSNISVERLNQQQADLKTAQADHLSQAIDIEEAQLNIERCQIRSPFAGVVTARKIGEGSWITPGQSLFEIIDSIRLEVSVQIAVDQIASLRDANRIQLVSNSGSYPLQLQRVVSTISNRGRNQEARLKFTGKAALPGATGRLKWFSQQRYIEADIPVRRNGQMGIFTLDNNRARFYPLPNAREGQPAQVNLPPQTALIIEGRHALTDGDLVEQAR